VGTKETSYSIMKSILGMAGDGLDKGLTWLGEGGGRNLE